MSKYQHICKGNAISLGIHWQIQTKKPDFKNSSEKDI